MTEEPLTTCPDCSGAVQKIMSTSSFQLKGGGWYADGYSNKAGNSQGSAAAATETPAKTGPEKAEKAAVTSKDSPAPPKSKESCPATT